MVRRTIKPLPLVNQYILMQKHFFNCITIMALLVVVSTASAQRRRALKPAGQPAEVQITPYKTTMLANGTDDVMIKVVVIDSKGNEVKTAGNLIRFSVQGDAHIAAITTLDKKNAAAKIADTAAQANLKNGLLWVKVIAGRTLGHIKFEAKSDSLWTGSTEIHTVQPGVPHKVTNDKYIAKTVKDKILGADISFLPELEAKGIRFSDKGVEKDAIQILKEHGFNYIRLRIFNDPAGPKGYSPNKGFCDLEHTKQMAKRVKAAGMKLLLDFHYSDYWADPQQQNKPAAWVGQDFTTLKKSVQAYTTMVMQQLKDQGTTPDMVQVGNEINHGMIWPDGQINNLDSLAQLIYAGTKGVKAISPKTIIMVHIALGGQSLESRFFMDNMTARNLPFDVIGLSYYPKWHGTPDDLKTNMADLSKRYNKQIMVAEYTQLKKEVNDIAFNVPGVKGIGSFIWEPLSTWEQIFDRDGKSNALIDVYPVIVKKYNIKP
jgi:arabinogalactan endo-1,4-beta-galactosidase